LLWNRLPHAPLFQVKSTTQAQASWQCRKAPRASCKMIRIYGLRLKLRKVFRWILQTNEQISRGLHRPHFDVRFLFAYTFTMFQGPSARKTFVVACKKCRRDVPTGAAEFPFRSVVVECPLCGEKRRYLPSEIFLGRVDQLVSRQMRTRAI
jgi:hypothetical protein